MTCMKGTARLWLRLAGRTRPPAWQSGFAVRRDWGFRGEHELFDWRSTLDAASLRLAADRNYWRRSPVRPTGWSVVEISRRDVVLHGRGRRGCKSPDCPTGISAVTAAAVSGVMS
jgi:hypothetical protein